jgi:putative SOS response-associated peptidase YedK
MLSVMCGRFTYLLTWEQIVRLYRLTLDQPAQNTRARFNVCPTTTIDTICSSGLNLRAPTGRSRLRVARVAEAANVAALGDQETIAF